MKCPMAGIYDYQCIESLRVPNIFSSMGFGICWSVSFTWNSKFSILSIRGLLMLLIDIKKKHLMCFKEIPTGIIGFGNCFEMLGSDLSKNGFSEIATPRVKYIPLS